MLPLSAFSRPTPFVRQARSHGLVEAGTGAIRRLPHVAAALDAAAADRPDAELVFIGEGEADERRWSYTQVRRRALEVASSLAAEHGLSAGARVALVIARPESFVPTFFGVLYAGGVPVPVYPPGVGLLESYLEHCRHILDAADASLLVTTRQIACELRRRPQKLAPRLHVVAACDDL